MLKFSMSQFYVPFTFSFFFPDLLDEKHTKNVHLVKVKYIFFKSEENFIAVDVLYIK
jgi:hypothetical protein